MSRKIRRIITLITFLLFPLILNYLSPYVCIDGAMSGVISGSLIVFGVMFLSGIFFRRAWCSFICPVACMSEICSTIQNKRVNLKVTRIVRYSIFTVWALVLVAGFIMAGGIKGIHPFHLTENFISVDNPLKFVTYYMVILLLVIVTLFVGRRGACQSVCWMSPFLVAGTIVGKALKLPQLKIRYNKVVCVSCGACDKKCPMSIKVSSYAEIGKVETKDCIQCGECIDACNKKALSYKIMNQ